MMPPLASGQQFDMTFTVDLNTIDGGPLPHGTYNIRILLNGWNWNCETNTLDNLIQWDTPVFEYTDALYGEYTVGGNAPDFNNLGQTVAALNSRGITDNVTFNLRPEYFNEQIIVGPVTGIDLTRTITFRTEPNKSDTAEISFAAHEGNYVIQFDNASYITLENLKLTSPGFTNYQSTYGRIIEIGDGSHHLTIQNCLLSGTDEQTHFNDDNALIFCGSKYCDNITIQDNKIENGIYGIALSGISLGDDAITNLMIINNDLENFVYSGINLEYVKNPLVSFNKVKYFTSPINQSFGIYLNNCEDGVNINGNQLFMEPSQNVTFGIYLQSVNMASETRGTVSNNFISMNAGGNPCSGLLHLVCKKIDIYYNSINIYGTSFNSSNAANFDCGTEAGVTYDNIIKNNIFNNQAEGYSILIGDNAITHNYVSSSDYNDLYSTGSYIGLYGYTNQVSDLATWQSATGFDGNSLSVDPEFISNTDLHTFSLWLDNMGTPVSPITYDIDLDERNWYTPDIGADEYVPPPPQYDVGVAQISSPVTGDNLTDQELVTIAIDNTGTETISNLQVSYTINGGPPVTEIYPGPIYAWEWHDYTFTTTADLSAVGSYEITAYTSLPGDERPANDDHTIIVEHLPPSYCIPLYTEYCYMNNHYIEDFSLNTIFHQWSYCSENNYGDFTGVSTDLTQGQSYTMEVSTGMGSMYVSLWIDLDDDTDFEPSEKLVSDLYCEFNFTMYSAIVNIPVSAIPGLHRIRLRAVHNETNFDPCSEYTNGEAHDYTANITSGGNLNVDLGPDLNDCYGTALILVPNVSGGAAPYNFLWSTGETTPTISTTPMYDSIYSVIVTDAFGYTAFDEVEIFMKQNPVAMASSNSPVCEGNDILLNGSGNYFGMAENRCLSSCELFNYCGSSAVYIEGPIVEEVIFGDINNNTMEGCGLYSDFTSMKTTVSIGDTTELFVTLNNCDKPYPKAGKAFIDWNRDGDFKDSYEVVGEFGFVNDEGYYDTIVIVPPYAELGKTLLRIVCRDAPNMDSIQECGSYWVGETEDYTVEIIERLENYIDTYSWTGPDSYSSLGQNPVIPASTLSNDGIYTLTVADGNGCIATDDTDVVVEINPTANAGANDIICETETYSLNGLATNYSSVLWSSSGNGSFDNNGILDPVYTPSIDDINNGEVTLTLLAFASAPCSYNALSSMILTIIKQPVVFAGNDATINEGETYVLSEATAIEYSNLDWSTTGTGSFDDAGILNPEYTPGTGETGIISLILTAYANSPCSEQKDTLELEILPYAGFDLDLKVFLHGPFNGIDMNTNLNSILPLSQPYSNSPWFYIGSETTAWIPNPDIVDWILVELRDATDASNATPGTMIGQQAAFLLKDGSVVDLDGTSILSFEHSIIQSLFVVVWHRNHVGVISANPLVRIDDVYSYDFTTDDLQVLGGSLGYKELVPGTWGMAGGDGDANGTVESADKTTIWVPDAGTNGYKVSDFNMDTQIDNKDKNEIWFFNLGKESQIPE